MFAWDYVGEGENGGETKGGGLVYLETGCPGGGNQRMSADSFLPPWKLAVKRMC